MYGYILCTIHVFEPYTIMDILLLAIIMTICCLCLLLFFLCYCFYTTVKLRHARPTWISHIVFFHLKFLCVFIRIAHPPFLSLSHCVWFWFSSNPCKYALIHNIMYYTNVGGRDSTIHFDLVRLHRKINKIWAKILEFFSKIWNSRLNKRVWEREREIRGDMNKW